eukprot:9066293-Pyramimonas_sp.AAC.1
MNNEMKKKLASDPKVFNQISKQFHKDKVEAKKQLEQWQTRQKRTRRGAPKEKEEKGGAAVKSTVTKRR